MTNNTCFFKTILQRGALGLGLVYLPLIAVAAPLTSADTNGDGQISHEEAMAAQNASFKRLDSNGDGTLSPQEFDNGQPGLPKDATDEDKAHRKTVVTSWFKRIDANGDHKITEAEYRKAVSPYFDRLDTNHDGVITKKELRASFEEAGKAQQELQNQP